MKFKSIEGLLIMSLLFINESDGSLTVLSSSFLTIDVWGALIGQMRVEISL